MLTNILSAGEIDTSTLTPIPRLHVASQKELARGSVLVVTEVVLCHKHVLKNLKRCGLWVWALDDG